MTEAYRTEQLANARKEADAASARYDACKTWGKKKRDAAEDLEFWTNKAAFLSNIKL